VKKENCKGSREMKLKGSRINQNTHISRSTRNVVKNVEKIPGEEGLAQGVNKNSLSKNQNEGGRRLGVQVCLETQSDGRNMENRKLPLPGIARALYCQTEEGAETLNSSKKVKKKDGAEKTTEDTEKCPSQQIQKIRL